MDNLLADLESKGLTWAQGGLASLDWFENEETRKWIIETSIHFAKGLNEGHLEDFSNVGPKGLIMLSQATIRILGVSEGTISKDLAIIAQYNATSKGIREGAIDFDIDFLCRGIINRGRSIDCGIYFQEQFRDGQYDQTFAIDMHELLNDYNQLMELLNQFGHDLPWEDEQSFMRACFNNTYTIATTLRGVYLQCEMAQELMIEGQKFEFAEALREISATINTNLMQSPGASPVTRIMLHGLFGYLFYFWKISGLMQTNPPLQTILDIIATSCSDEEDLEPHVQYYTLFAHIIRLRIYSETPELAQGLPQAIDLAEQALHKSDQINRYDTYERLIESFKNSNIFDFQECAEQLFMTW